MAMSDVSNVLAGVSRSSLLKAVKAPEQAAVSFKDLLKQLNQKLGIHLETPAQLLAVKFLEQRFNKNTALQNKYGSFENFLKSVIDSGKLDKMASRIEEKLKGTKSLSLNFDHQEMQSLSAELDQELEISDNDTYLSQDQFLEPASDNDFRNSDSLQKLLLGIREDQKKLIDQIHQNRLEQDLVEQKLREKRLANLEVQKQELAKAELGKDQDLAALRSKKITNPVAFSTQRDLIMGSFQSKKLQAGLITA